MRGKENEAPPPPPPPAQHPLLLLQLGGGAGGVRGVDECSVTSPYLPGRDNDGGETADKSCPPRTTTHTHTHTCTQKVQIDTAHAQCRSEKSSWRRPEGTCRGRDSAGGRDSGPRSQARRLKRHILRIIALGLWGVEGGGLH